MRQKLFSILLVIMILNSACESWLDVQPRTKIKSDDLFETEAGFKDALIGAYTLMKAEELYGRELSFGFIEAVTGVYNVYSNTTYADVQQWRYTTSSSVRNQIDNMWGNMYNLIANLNNLLDNIDSRQSVFTGDNYNIIKGEALGLRAYAHFDLLRLFASATNLDNEAIPYVRTLQIEVPQVYTGREILALCNEDITNALACLANDPIREGIFEDLSDDGFLNDRGCRMNYYAVKALQARVAMWGGDLETAQSAASEILEIADEIFPWVTTDAISTTEERNRDFSFSTEQIFALDVRDLQTLANTWFFTGETSTSLTCQEYTMQQWFEIGRGNNVGSYDYRVNYVLYHDETNRYYVTRKYYQPDNYNSDYARRIPLIRRSEMNLIMAECLIDENPSEALNYLNELRQHRGIPTDITDVTTLRDEITKEYAKEFMAEGQLFYYCKRNALSTFPYGYQSATEENVYVLPKPDNELEFGDYYTVE